MIHKQGAEYKDSSEIEQAVQEDEAARKKFSPVIIVLGVVVAFAVVLAAVYFCMQVVKQESEPAQPTDSGVGTIVGDDDYWSQFDDPETFSYTDEEKQQLRAWGYTGDEIEKKQSEEVPASELIAQSKKAQEEARATLSNPESPEYQALLNNTWLGQQAITLPEYVEGVTEGSIHYDTHVLNADYDKVPAHGQNLFLKVHLNSSSYVFMECPLLRYMQLPDSGNIVVQYQTATINGVTIVHSMQEVTVS